MNLLLIFRLVRVVLHMFTGMAIAATVFPWAGRERRDGIVRRWSRKLLAICNVTVEQDPASVPVLAQAMVVSNHVSWLDIFVLNSLHPCRFVAKAEIRSWPVLGWLAAAAGTVFIARGNRRELRHIFKGIVAVLEQGERVAFFPEGTTANQGQLLPFHANLFEAAIDAKVQVQPFAVSYRDASGALHAAVDFIGETTFAQSLISILNATPVQARVISMPAMSTEGAHRRELAEAAQTVVAAALGVSASAH